MKSIKIFLLLFILLSGCKKEKNEVPYFSEFHSQFCMSAITFYKQDMLIKNNKEFRITIYSSGDSSFNMPVVNDTIYGMITNQQMDSLINFCKLADVYHVKFSNKVHENDSVICEKDSDFSYSIEITGEYENQNFLSYTYCFIPREAYDLQYYSNLLMMKYSE
jgi:hypothetical protein